VFWLQRGLELQEREGPLLEGRRFAELVEGDAAVPEAEAILGQRGQVGDQGREAVDGAAVRSCWVRALPSASEDHWAGVTGSSAQGLLSSRNRSGARLAQVPAHVVSEHAEEEVRHTLSSRR
jgi:hypothetical protein